ncbi:uncharacterized protein [Littorina saxatilis]|uniref:uncharacterized protein isoform X4 n=1 Tax=Littorina saxatilis TaxID=31220 RepID=UPI0038B4403C
MADARPDKNPTLTERDVIIIACVCAVIIITLLIVLICFICRRRRANGKEYDNSGVPPPASNGGVPVKKMQQGPGQSYDNADGRADGFRGQQESIHMQSRPMSPSKDKYIDLEDRKDPSLQSQESGYSTGDINKPKKVIYEVVV